MHVLKMDFNGNPNVGLYAYANDEFCLVGKDISVESAKKISKVLGVPVHRITMCGTSLIGVFVAGNSRCILVPSIAFEEELAVLDKLKIKYKVFETKLTALGNNILVNDKGCIVNPEFSKEERAVISEALGVDAKKGRISGLDIVGACATYNDKGIVIHRDVVSKEADVISQELGLECTNGTVNMGSPYVSSGLIANSKGFVVGELSSGPEIQFVDEGLGFIEF